MLISLLVAIVNLLLMSIFPSPLSVTVLLRYLYLFTVSKFMLLFVMFTGPIVLSVFMILVF